MAFKYLLKAYVNDRWGIKTRIMVYGYDKYHYHKLLSAVKERI